jgi:hypothetical protein
MIQRLFVLIATLVIFFTHATPTHAQVERASGSSATLAPLVDYITTDTRIEAMRAYLQKHNSPLTPYAEVFVAQADLYQLPWELVVSIAGVESTFGKFVPCTNAWGWGIYGDNMHCFEDYAEGIKVISKTLREKYINEWGVSDIHQMGRYYASSPTWSQNVMYFVNDIRRFKVAYDVQSLPISF